MLVSNLEGGGPGGCGKKGVTEKCQLLPKWVGLGWTHLYCETFQFLLEKKLEEW